ncbi:hypothetical protein [Bosea sp. BK604]|uniref:hypothetical protein n=1 Tax=Bosea sp. BK604 TaxID=2512180 RepID=UPI0010461561|nr:hypothetical protein [Bosea sp. BK604]TCR64683.1 hypothetical protein EV560_106149 [Bosea sp. BK604]
MTARRYIHAGREVEAMRFVGNGPDIARWYGLGSLAMGSGLAGRLMLGVDVVEAGDWVVRDVNGRFSVWDQVTFAHRFREVRNANVN